MVNSYRMPEGYRSTIKLELMNYKTLLAVLIILSFDVDAQNPVPGDEVSIRNSRIGSNQAIAKHDTASLATFWTEDVHVTTSRSIELSGRLTNQRAFQQEFQNKEKLLYVRTTNTIEVFPKWNMAAEYGNWVGTWSAGGTAIKVGGSYYAKWHKDKVSGVW